MNHRALDVRRAFIAQVLAAGAALLIAKLALYQHVIFAEGGKLAHFAKIFLCLGMDVVGAFVFGVLALGGAVLGAKIGGVRTALVVAASMQAAHGFYLALSYEVTRVIGAPLFKAGIDLAFANSDASSTGVWSSVTPYLTPGVFAFLLFVPAVSVFVSARTYAQPIHPPPWARVAFAGLALISATFTAIVLPNVRNGEYFGARIHTYGLERSHFVSLIGSYAARPLRRLITRTPAPADPFCFSLAPIAAKATLDAPPLAQPTDKPPSPRRTNVVLVFLESVAATYAGEGRMPFLDDLADRDGGARFERHYALWPQTMKSYFNVFCSELPYPEYLPITHMNPAIPCVSLTEALHDDGYRTAFFSSADMAYDRQMRFFQHRKLDVIHDMGTMPGRQGAWATSWGVDESVTIRAALSWIDETRAGGGPFALVIATSAGHHPYSFPGREPGVGLPAEREAYIATLRYIDDRLRELADGLSSRGLFDDTLFVVVSDHGEAFGEHPTDTMHGNHVYEPAMRVPFVLSGPQLKGAHRRVPALTSHLDVAPTLLGLLAVPVPITMKGRDLAKSRAATLVPFKSRPPASQIGVRDGDFKYVHTGETGGRELFDLSSDPGETQNLAASHAALVQQYDARLSGWEAHSANLIEGYASILKRHGHACPP